MRKKNMSGYQMSIFDIMENDEKIENTVTESQMALESCSENQSAESCERGKSGKTTNQMTQYVKTDFGASDSVRSGIADNNLPVEKNDKKEYAKTLTLKKNIKIEDHVLSKIFTYIYRENRGLEDSVSDLKAELLLVRIYGLKKLFHLLPAFKMSDGTTVYFSSIGIKTECEGDFRKYSWKDLEQYIFAK